MRFDRFCRKPVAPAPQRAGGKALRALGLSLALLPLAGSSFPIAYAAGTADPLIPVARTPVLPKELQQAKPLGRLPADTELQIALTLPWHDAAGLDNFIKHVTDPTDPMHGKFLTHQQFVDRYSPTVTDYETLKTWAQSNGLSIVSTSPNRMLLVVSGKRDAVESAFHVQLNNFQLASGRTVYLNDTLPKLPQSIAAHISSVIGLNDYPQVKPQYRRKSYMPGSPIPGDALLPRKVSAHAAPGTGPGDGVTPADIRSLYNINPLSTAGLDGTGQTVALYEQNGYVASDISEYASFYGLPAPNLQNITLNGFNGVPTSVNTEGEVNLDIEMIMAVAPKAKILIYEFDDQATSTFVGISELLSKIINDDLAPVISISYGTDEDNANLGGLLGSINALFQQAIAQGQCIYGAAGDNGAYDTGSEADGLRVDFPGSDPFSISVGGTSLNNDPIVNGVATYGTETSWNDGVSNGVTDGGGGGVSKYWPIPTFQTGAVTGANTTNGISTTMRNVPDVSLNADPNTGYSVFEADSGTLTAGGVTGFDVVGGTSAATPLWAAFNLLVNQQRTIYGLSSLGFANPSIYKIAEGTDYAADFHDINDNTTNLFYPAVTGYDDSTGWGSYNAANLLPEFAPSTFGSAAINVKVVDANGNAVSGATVTAVTSQISGYQLTATSASDGTASFTVPTGVHNYNNSGADVTLSFIVSADLSGYAGTSQAGVTPPTTTPITLRILPTDHTYTSGTLQMISAPYDYSTVGDFATLFGLSTPITSGSAALFAYSPNLTGYLEYPTAPADTLRLGQGYWAVLPGNAYVQRKGVAAPTNQAFRINLLPGWNMIGDPFPTAVSISNIQVDTVVPGTPIPLSGATTVQLPLYFYNGTEYQTLTTGDTMQPFSGYWIHATQAAELVIPVP